MPCGCRGQEGRQAHGWPWASLWDLVLLLAFIIVSWFSHVPCGFVVKVLVVGTLGRERADAREKEFQTEASYNTPSRNVFRVHRVYGP